MDDLTNSQQDGNGVTHAVMARPTTWDDQLPIDHHIEELLGAFSAVACLGLEGPSDASA